MKPLELLTELARTDGLGNSFPVRLDFIKDSLRQLQRARGLPAVHARAYAGADGIAEGQQLGFERLNAFYCQLLKSDFGKRAWLGLAH